MLQQSTMNTRKNHPGQKKTTTVPKLFGAINQKTRGVQIPTAINQAGISVYPFHVFPPPCFRPKSWICLFKNKHRFKSHGTNGPVCLPTYIFFSVSFLWESKGWFIDMQVFPFSCIFSPWIKIWSGPRLLCMTGPVLDHSSSLDTPGGLDHWIVGLGFAICLRCLGPK